MLLERTTPRVLIMEWVEGQRLRRAGRNGEGPSRAELQADLKLVEIGVQCSLEQACILPYQTWCSAAPPMAQDSELSCVAAGLRKLDWHGKCSRGTGQHAEYAKRCICKVYDQL